MKKRTVFGGTLILLVICLIFLGKLFAYSTTFTHPHLTEESVKFYEKFESDYEFSNEEIGWIIKGNQEEDTSSRYINHFYDPKNNLPWLGSNPVALTAKDWANSSKIQSLYTGGDQSFKRAVYEYREGNIKEAFVALGHILHLVQDMSVPEHTRNDTHIPGPTTESPYEVWAENYNKTYKDPIAKNLIDNNKQLSKCFSLDNCFNEVANYSNSYFFSIDSLDNYATPFISRWDDEYIAGIKVLYGYGEDMEKTEFRLIRKNTPDWRNFSEITDYKLDDNVLSDYWERLSAKSVQTGAQVINLFFKQIQYEEENNIPNTEPLSWWDEIVNSTKVLLGLAPKITGATVVAADLPIEYLSNNVSEKLSLNEEEDVESEIDSSTQSENDEDVGGDDEEILKDTKGEDNNNEKVSRNNEGESEDGEKVDNGQIDNTEEDSSSLVIPAEAGIQSEEDNTEESENDQSVYISIEDNQTSDVGGADEDIEDEITEVMNDAIAVMENQLLAQNNPQNNEESNDVVEAISTNVEDYSQDEEDVEEQEENIEDEESLEEENINDEDMEEDVEEDTESEEPEEILEDEEEVTVKPFYVILFSEIKVGGGEYGSANDEFVELYNPHDFDVSLAGWKLRPFTDMANPKSYLLRPFPDNAVIPSHGYYLIAHEDYAGAVLPDAYYSTGSSIADNNSLVLYDDSDRDVDIVGWGDVSIFESDAAIAAPKGGSIERKAKLESTTESMSRCGIDEFRGNRFDGNSNYQDFVVRVVSDPQNSNSLIEPREGYGEGCSVVLEYETLEETEEIEVIEEGIVEDDGNEQEDQFEEEMGEEEDDIADDEEIEQTDSDIEEESGVDTEEDTEENPVVIFEGPPVLTGLSSGEIMVLVPELSPYVVSGEFTVEENATLVIEAGVVLKFGKEYMATWKKFPTRMRVEGNLFVNGTEENPVIFTSIADDRFGGDTNLDGDATSPAPFDWSRLLIESDDSHQVNISYAHFYYAGSDNGSFGNSAALVSRGGAIVNVDHCYFSNNPTAISNFAWYGPESKQINVTNSLIENNGSGIILDVYAPIRLFHTTIRNNSDYGIYLEASSPDVFYAEHNNIYGNGKYGLWNFYGAAAKGHALPEVEISAQENWWGDTSGPAPMGEGNKVGGKVDFSDWLGEELML